MRAALTLAALAALAAPLLPEAPATFADLPRTRAHAQEPTRPPLSGRAAVEALTFEPLDFRQPDVAQLDVDGVRVLLLEDHTLPLVTVHAYFLGGYGRFARERYAAAMGLPALLRYGGTTERSPPEVDEAIESRAFQLSFGTAGGSVTTSLNTLTEHLAEGLDLWGEMLAEPGFDEGEIAAWRARQLESVLRRTDDPALLAYSELNRLLYGDHPVGWEMDPDDLAPARVDAESFGWVHARVICRDNAVLGFTGDVDRSEVEPFVRRLVDRLPPCAEPLPEPPVPDIRRLPGVYVIEKELEQAVVVMAHPSAVRLADDDAYFAATIGNTILGAGGFSSRLLGRVRTEEGFAYTAASLWTTPRRHEGLIGATTRTRPENAVPAIEVILSTMQELRGTPPTAEEVSTSVDQIVNGFVFAFDSPGQIVARQMYYLAQELPEDWLERYWRGVQRVTPASVGAAFAEHLRPEAMTILVVGDSERMGRERLEALGPVTVLEVR